MPATLAIWVVETPSKPRMANNDSAARRILSRASGPRSCTPPNSITDDSDAFILSTFYFFCFYVVLFYTPSAADGAIKARKLPSECKGKHANCHVVLP